MTAQGLVQWTPRMGAVGNRLERPRVRRRGTERAKAARVSVWSAALLSLLVPLRGWTEESPVQGAVPAQVGPVHVGPVHVGPAPSAEGGPSETGVSEALPRAGSLALEAPWQMPEPGAPVPEAACTPWSSHEHCTGEAEMLIDPWSGAPDVGPVVARILAPAAIVSSDPTPAPSIAPLLRADPAPEATTLELAANEARTPADSDHDARAPSAPAIPSLDSWVVDRGAPETPFE